MGVYDERERRVGGLEEMKSAEEVKELLGLSKLSKVELSELEYLVDRFYEIDRYIDIMKQSREEVLDKLKKYYKVSNRWHFEIRVRE